MPGIDFDRLREQIPIERVLGLLGFTPFRRTRNQWYGPCPLHESKSARRPCFSVNIATGRYCCHRCHSQGHQIQLWAAAVKLPLHPAAIDLCRALGQEVPWIHRW